MRHLITLDDISVEELNRILDLSATIKSELKQGIGQTPLDGKMMAMIFEKPSLRTRVSFETGMFQLGGSSMFLGSDAGFGKREATKDFSKVLSSMVDVIVLRALRHESVVEMAKYATCPVINALTDREHPCQALADVMTVKEVFGETQGLKIAWVGDANNVAASLVRAAAKLGMAVSVAAPAGYQLAPGTDAKLGGTTAVNGFSLELTDDPEAAVAGAHAVYTDVWVSMGQEAEEAERKKNLAPYRVDTELMQKARKDAIFLHCLPARRGQEVTDEVMDSPQSRIVQQSENRLHSQKGLLVWLLNETQ